MPEAFTTRCCLISEGPHLSLSSWLSRMMSTVWADTHLSRSIEVMCNRKGQALQFDQLPLTRAQSRMLYIHTGLHYVGGDPCLLENDPAIKAALLQLHPPKLIPSNQGAAQRPQAGEANRLQADEQGNRTGDSHTAFDFQTVPAPDSESLTALSNHLKQQKETIKNFSEVRENKRCSFQLETLCNHMESLNHC